MQVWTELSTKQVFQNARPGANSSNRLELISARNAYVSGQVVLRDIQDFTITKVKAFCDENLSKRAFVQEYCTFNDATAYPDELTEIKINEEISFPVKAHAARSIWVDLFVPKSFSTGKTEIKIDVETSVGNVEAIFALEVNEISIPDSNKSLFNHEYFFNLGPKAAIGDTPTFSPEWWEHMEKMAKIFVELRNNAILIQPNPLLLSSGSTKTSDTTWEFNFDNWDRFVDLFLKAGAAKSFTISALHQSVEGKFIGAIGENNTYVEIPTPSSEGEIYVAALWKAIYEHIKGNGTLHLFRSHIEDEPHTTETWLWAREIIKKVAPDLPCSEPIDMIESAYGLSDACDIMVPRTNVYEENVKFFQNVMKEKELWVYSCCFPEEGWWLNKFIDLPFIRSRIMEWNCVKEGISGFLHWGFNYFGKNSPYGIGPDARFKGDGHIVYPDPENKSYKLSARFINTRDGLQDAEVMLMKMKTNPSKVKAIIETVVKNNYEFSDEPSVLDNAMREIFLCY